MKLMARYMHKDSGLAGDIVTASRLLRLGDIYEVTRVEVDRWFTRIWLDGYGDGDGNSFNSCMFDFYKQEQISVPKDLIRGVDEWLFPIVVYEKGDWEDEE